VTIMKTTRAHHLLFLALVSTLSACGAPFVDGEYTGDPLATVEGNVILDFVPRPGETHETMRLGVYWLGNKHAHVAHTQVRATGSFPARYMLRLYDVPQAALAQRWDWSDAELAIGHVIAYDDLNGNEAWDADDEPVVGWNDGHVVVWNEADPDSRFPLGFSIGELQSCASFTGNATEPDFATRPFRVSGLAELDVNIVNGPLPLEQLDCSLH